MSKTISSNPTTNIFELLQVDSDLPEKRSNTTTKVQAGGKKPLVDSSPALETPAEKGQRRKLQEAQKAAVEKQKKEAEALYPAEGFQVQKGSKDSKKPAEKKTTLKREDFETTKPVSETQKPFTKGPKKTDGSGKPFDARRAPHDGERRQQNPARPQKHEGFDKHSGAKTSNKPGVKRQGGGQGNWGKETQPEWSTDVVTTPAADASTGWGDESEKKEKVASKDGDDKTEKTDKADKTDAKDEKPRPPAWDEEEGHGKILLDQFQKDIAAEREAKLAALGVAPKSTGRTVEPAADSKFTLVYRDTTDEKEKLLGEERRKQIAEEKKKRQQQRVGEKPVNLADYTNFGVRGGGGAGRGRGGRGGDRPDRPPRTEGDYEQQGSASPEQSRPARGGRGGRGGSGGPGGFRVPKASAFPELGAVPVKAAPVKAKAAPVAAPKSTK